ncbi:hypothetical protein [Gulosibacter molinativorax]|nr:hypothetical protein [Gulosibacter molinativorax]QUY60866.1 Hypotetical protein [Gulosibacter molinativorax]
MKWKIARLPLWVDTRFPWFAVGHDAEINLTVMAVFASHADAIKHTEAW